MIINCIGLIINSNVCFFCTPFYATSYLSWHLRYPYAFWYDDDVRIHFVRHDATCNYHSFASTLSVYLTLLQLGCFLAGQHTKACRTKMCYLRYSPINHTFRSALRMTPDLLKAIKFFNILTVFELTKVIVSRKLCILVPCCTHSSFTPFVYWMLEFILWIDIKYASCEDDDICHGLYFTKRICVIATSSWWR